MFQDKFKIGRIFWIFNFEMNAMAWTFWHKRILLMVCLNFDEFLSNRRMRISFMNPQHLNITRYCKRLCENVLFKHIFVNNLFIECKYLSFSHKHVMLGQNVYLCSLFSKNTNIKSKSMYQSEDFKWINNNCYRRFFIYNLFLTESILRKGPE